MAHYDTFREQLAIRYPAFGHALWEPSPDGGRGPVEIGDVGYIRQGKFHRLFNTLLSTDHPSHRGVRLPEHHEPLIPQIPDHIDRGTLQLDHYCSEGVTMESDRADIYAMGPPDIPQVSFSCTRRQGGAVLSLPVNAQRQDTRATGDFRKWMVKHIDSWFAFARGLGLGIEQMEEIVLVTGLHLTRSWANIVFLEGHANGHASFGVRVDNNVGITWQFLPGSVRGGMRSWGPEGMNLPENQCVFIRGLRVTRVFGIFPRRLRGAAGPNSIQGGDHDDDEPDKELVSMDSASKNRDPLYVLLEYVKEQAQDCDMVLVHDDDLARIRENLQPDALADHLQISKPEIEQVLYDCASANESDSTAASVTVAMLSDESQELGLAHQNRLTPPLDIVSLKDSAPPPESSITVPADTVHQYKLKSRWKHHALVTIMSHATNARDSPLLYTGEDLKGFVELTLDNLNGMQSMDVVLQMFDSDTIIPSCETKRILLSQQVDNSNISDGKFIWPFAIAALSSPDSSWGSSSTAVWSPGNRTLNGDDAGSKVKFQLSATIHRRGRLTPNLAMKQEIFYVPPPDPPKPSSSDQISVDHSHISLATLDSQASWPQQRFPPVTVKGVIFNRTSVEVQCKLISPSSYPAVDLIPLRLVLISENREALDLFSVSHIIDVRLQKVMGFGEQAAVVRPFTLRDRNSYHRSDYASRARWELDGHAQELLPDEEHARPRWRVKLNGQLLRESLVELTPSFEGSGMALMYFICLFPFRSTDFRPANDPSKPLLMGKIRLTSRAKS